MSTCNYEKMKLFDLWTSEYEYDNDLTDDDNMYASEDFYDDIINCSEDILNEINNKLNFYKLELQGGYYDGVQLIAHSKIISDLDDDFENLTNEDTQYYFDMCRSEYLRKIKSEIHKINKKYLPQFKDIGFHKLNCVGIFSNGEAIYELA